MRTWIGVAGAAAGVMTAVPLAAQLTQPADGAVSFVSDSGRWTQALFVCDPVAGGRALALTAPDRQRQAALLAVAGAGQRTGRMAVRIGAGDPGMGQVWYPLTDPAGREVGAIHTVNPAMVDPGATTPSVVGVRLNNNERRCRFLPQTRVLGVTAKRSIQITAGSGGYVYRSYNDGADLPEVPQQWGGVDTRASLTMDGGRLIDRSNQRRVYQFERAGYVYRVTVSLDPQRAGGGVQVLRDGQSLLVEPFTAYTANGQR